ncbi:MAG: glycosyltransferase family 2 protein [Kouleothrix sp.]|jgi:dolichol-phosphate mannosyltransferase|nr:glycosyltransferase family 2 protein [Kouleothrix sp.]
MYTAEPIAAIEPQHNAARRAGPPVFSIVGPVYNEEALLEEFCLRTIEVLAELGEPFELVLVNDGSRDRSPEILRRLHQRDQRVKVINFSRNFGLQAALTAGLDHARGQAIVVMDTDLQDPPEVLPQLIAKWREGYQLVYAQRAERAGETWFKKVTASAFYRLIARITSIQIPIDTGEFRLMDRKVVDAIVTMREYNRFMRGMSVWVGYKQAGITYERDARKAGETKFSLGKMVRLALDGITSFSYLPLQLATYFGFFVALLSLVFLIAVLLLRSFFPDFFYGQATTLAMVLFLGSVQLIFLGIIGEYLGRIYDEVKKRPLYIVAEELGFEEPRAG